jgi:hypothetical protein
MHWKESAALACNPSHWTKGAEWARRQTEQWQEANPNLTDSTGTRNSVDPQRHCPRSIAVIIVRIQNNILSASSVIFNYFCKEYGSDGVIVNVNRNIIRIQ